MIERSRKIDLVCLEIRTWRQNFAEAVNTLALKSGRPLVDLVPSENLRVPRNKVLLYMHPKQIGRVCLLHHPDDWEAVHALLGKSDMRWGGVEPLDEEAKKHASMHIRF